MSEMFATCRDYDCNSLKWPINLLFKVTSSSLLSHLMKMGFGGWLPFLGWGGLAKVRLFLT